MSKKEKMYTVELVGKQSVYEARKDDRELTGQSALPRVTERTRTVDLASFKVQTKAGPFKIKKGEKLDVPETMVKALKRHIIVEGVKDDEACLKATLKQDKTKAPNNES